jgi:ATP-dependent DNA helicase RecG
MPSQNASVLIDCLQRARKVLQHEQRTNYQDRAIRPGGLETFAAIWAEQASTALTEVGLGTAPVHRFLTHFEGYRQQDPIQRAANLRAALSILDDLENSKYTAPPTDTAQRSPQGKSLHMEHSEHTAPPTGTARVPALQASISQPASHTSLQDNALKNAELGQPEETAGAEPVLSPRPLPQNQVRLEAGMTRGHASMTLLNAEVTAVPGVGATVASKLRYLGIHTVRDLLFYFPRDHRDYSKLIKIASIPFNELVTTMGMVWEVENRRTSGGRIRTIATISDETGKLYLSWFNQPYLKKQLKEGMLLVVTGTKQRFGNKVEFAVRSHEFPEQGDLLNTGRLVPIYPLTEGLHEKALRRFTKWAVDHYAALVPEHLPATILEQAQLLALPDAIAQIHYPDNEDMLHEARHRLAFDELFLIQMGMQERRSRWQHEAPQGIAFHVDLSRIFLDPPAQQGSHPTAHAEPTGDQASIPGSTLWSMIASQKPFEASLAFALTPAQRRVILEIAGDLSQSKPMCRLLQGDVGAGKTVVAAAALFIAALNGYQGAIMAPTELLAEQHARGISDLLEPFGIRTVLLTGSLKPRERAMGREALESGQATVAIGTHALIQEDVNFQKLGLVIVDEQHRFGVEQRDALRKKGYHPHMLVMTATPIPRTLALTLYGDLDISVIDQLPPGRQKIITRWRSGARRSEANKQIAEQVEQGHQAFIICPLIEESESLAAKAATTEYERLKREVFPHYRLGLLHGAMKAAEKDDVMRRFRDGELDILVATSVIEVGIDIPNATVMVIEDADRFGLSQLHQFRGRVGRGKYQSYCYVLSAGSSLQSQERLEIFQNTDDGFRLSEEDLRLRGPGDFIGVRQSGMPELRIADLSDTPLIELARKLAAQLWERDPYLRQPEHASLRERMHLFWQNFMAH